MKQGRVMGSPVVATSRDEARACLERWIAERRREYVVLANVHVVETARRDPGVADALARAGLVLPDGAPVAWAVARQTGERSERVTGSDVFDALCRASLQHGYRHFFYGSSRGTLDTLVRRVAEQYPGLTVCGSLAPPFADRVEVRDAIDAARPDVVWVGLGAPKQELWMRAARERLEAPLLVGVGAVFDFASGRKRRAPLLLQRLGLEWTHRLAHEPRRLAGRYLTTNTSFLLGLLRSGLGGEP